VFAQRSMSLRLKESVPIIGRVSGGISDARLWNMGPPIEGIDLR
jgi:hypothetical protein